MNGRIGLAVVCASLCAAGLADAKSGKGPKGSPLDGNWTANGTVAVARHIENVTVGDHVTRTWTFKSKCAKKCHTTLNYRTSSGKPYSVPLTGGGKSYSGTLENQTFSCTNGTTVTTVTGSLAFKVKVKAFTMHKKRKFASDITARGIQTASGTNCPGVKEIVDFKLTRRSF